MSTAPDLPPSLRTDPSRMLVRLLVGLAVAAAGAWLIRYGTYEQTLVSWECFAGTCATDDFAGAAPILGVLVLLGAVAALSPVTRQATVGLLVVVGSGAALLGWSAAVRDGLNTDEALRRPTAIVWTVLGIGAVAAVVGAVRSLGRSTAARVRGLVPAWARVRDYEGIDGRRCHATVHFADASGTRHAVRTVVPQDAFKHAPVAYYDPERPDDPARLRVVVPAQPLMAAVRTEREAAVRRLLPLPDDDLVSTPPRTPRTASRPAASERAGADPSVVDALERLRDLHTTGALTDDEYAAAKSRLLAPPA
ncbi:SHOCT domain-containing protein [Cellulomonas triticagri]|uniref:SHOCT domain-containing protein n=1 Tax=Cellulomonas triticagri TaxID=2483352 RepID=UPI0018F46945|nr:SHOCT domain-containing protein [Cellulomonas triticagri]